MEKRVKFKQTEIGMVPEDWKERNLSEVVEIIGGGTPKTTNPNFWNGKIPWISVVDFVGDRKWIFGTEKSITKKGLENSSTKLLDEGQIIISARGTVGEIGQLKRKMAFNQSCYGLNSKELLTNDFLYYLLRYKVDKIKSVGHGAVFNTITRDTFDNILVFLPPLPEQSAISHILSTLDEKIELLQKQNKTLEEIGQAIFKKWFIDNPEKEGWEVGKLGDVLKLKMGISPKGETYNDQGMGCPLLNGAADFSGKVITPKKFTTAPIKLCKKGDIVFCIRATIGNITFADREYCLGRGVAALEVEERWKEFVYYFLKKSLDEMISGAYGSVIKGLSKPDIERFEMIIPERSLIEKFNGMFSIALEKQKNNDLQIQTLSQIRDYLLPKLMSGKIRVKWN